MTAVKWLQMVLIPIPYDEEDVEHNRKCWEQAKAMESEQIVEEKIELIKSIGNQGKNAPLYGILKKTLLELHKQYNEIRTRCLN
jgi:hypothetical protein